MFRAVLCVAAALLTFGIATASARADDGAGCAKASGDEAIAACSRPLARNPRNSGAYHNRGVTYYNKGDYDRAIADYDQAIRLDPKSAGYYLHRGETYNAKGEHDRAVADYDQAIRLLDQVIRLDPKNAIAYHAVAGSISTRESMAARSPIVTRRSRSIRNLPPPTTAAALPIMARVISIARSRTLIRRSGSIRNLPKPMTITAMSTKPRRS
jgi:tetratricopeptide (TPR) repeat protein